MCLLSLRVSGWNGTEQYLARFCGPAYTLSDASQVPTNDLTTGEVAARLGIKPGMVRRYALALADVTGISLQVDPVRGRLYPVPAVELLEAARAHLLAHPGLSVEAALRAVTGQSDGGSDAPCPRARHRDSSRLHAALAEAFQQMNAPVLAALEPSSSRPRRWLRKSGRCARRWPASAASCKRPGRPLNGSRSSRGPRCPVPGLSRCRHPVFWAGWPGC